MDRDPNRNPFVSGGTRRGIEWQGEKVSISRIYLVGSDGSEEGETQPMTNDNTWLCTPPPLCFGWNVVEGGWGEGLV